MKQLSEECIKAIEDKIERFYPSDLGYDNVVTTLESTQNIERRNCCSWGFTEALTNPEIYTKADLIHKEEMFEFVEWANDNAVNFAGNKWNYLSNENIVTTEELFNLYINQKEAK